jgi:hypothetical protein
MSELIVISLRAVRAARLEAGMSSLSEEKQSKLLSLVESSKPIPFASKLIYSTKINSFRQNTV